MLILSVPKNVAKVILNSTDHEMNKHHSYT